MKQLSLFLFSFFCLPTLLSASNCEDSLSPTPDNKFGIDIMVDYLNESLADNSRSEKDLIENVIRIFQKICVGGDGWGSSTEKKHILEDYEGNENYRLHIWEAEYDPFGKVEGIVDALNIERSRTFLKTLFSELKKIKNGSFKTKLREQIETYLSQFNYASLGELTGDVH